MAGADDEWSIRTPEIGAPRASPPSGKTLLRVAASPGRLLGSRSTTAADKVDIKKPVAVPWTMRATISAVTESACQNVTMLAASTTKPNEMIGRRPMWSDSDPTTSSVTNRAPA